MRIVACKNYEDMSRKAASLIAAQVVLKPDCVLGLATGGSPVGTYQQLIKWYEKGDLDFSRVRSVNLDEYVGLDESSDQSYVYFMRDNLFDHVNIDLNNTNVPCGVNPNAEEECARYDEVIRNYGGIDLQLLGMGPNGHIGFNEPDDHFPMGTHKVELTDATIQANKRFFEKEEDVPRYAYTMGVGSIMAAKRIVMVVSGKGKAEIVKKAFAGPVCPEVPASILQLHPDFVLVADEDALSELCK